MVPLAGVQPAISLLEAGRVLRYATEALLVLLLGIDPSLLD